MIADADPGDEHDRVPPKHWRTCDICGVQVVTRDTHEVPVPLGISEMSPLLSIEVASRSVALPARESLLVCSGCSPVAHAFHRERQQRWVRR